MIDVPDALRVNAWTGSKSPAQEMESTWDVPRQRVSRAFSSSGKLGLLADPRNWRDPKTGWGLVLPDDLSLDAATKARGEDAPAPLRELLKARGGAPVLRWSPDLPRGKLTRYYEDGGSHQREIAAPTFGTGVGQIPRYLLIHGGPDVIPWQVQYDLNLRFFVGRLDLEGDALANYVAALLSDWSGQAADPSCPLTWSVDHGAPDITAIMARAIGRKLSEAFRGDPRLQASRFLSDGRATCANLVTAIHEQRPALICTTSHGMTGPLGDSAVLQRDLGSPVDAEHNVLSIAALSNWSPDGAIWYSHGCCAAGSDAQSRYAGLFDASGELGQTLYGVAAGAGARIAPLPRHLLGLPRPLRAFIGHVEPTFDWTLRDPTSKEDFAHTIIQCLYNYLYDDRGPAPVGWALQEIFSESGTFYGTAQLPGAEASGDHALTLYRKLVAMDRQTLVVLGDPTVSLPLLAS